MRKNIYTSTVALRSGGIVAVTLIGDFITLGTAERVLVGAIGDALRAYAPSAADSAVTAEANDAIDNYGAAVLANAALPLNAPDDPAKCPEMRREIEARAILHAALTEQVIEVKP